MDFLSPMTGLLAAAVALPTLIALYFLKLRRREVVIPSTLLWKKAIQDMQVNAPFQRLRKNLLLLLQLIILIALLIAMARPTMQAAARPGQRIAIILDHSASMNATDVSPTRLDEAKRAALELIGALESGENGAGVGMVVSFAQRARVVQPFTGDTTLLRAAVRNVQPTDQRSELQSALKLVEPFAMEAQSDDAKGLVVYVVSDGRVHMPADQAMALKGAELRFLRVGRAGGADNVGVISMAARRDFERPERVQVFAQLANYSSEAKELNLELRLDDALTRVQVMNLPGMTDGEPAVQAAQFDFILPGAALVTLSHDHSDALTADNTARLTLAPARRLRVLLVGDRNPFLERVIRSVGVRELVLMHPQKFEDQNPEQLGRAGWDAMGTAGGVDEGFDVIVFDGYAPKQVPPVDSVYFGVAPAIGGLGVRGDSDEEAAKRAQVILDWQRDNALLRYVVLDDVLVAGGNRLAVPVDGQVLATGQRGPVMAEVRRDGVRHVVVSFDVLRSNWPMQVSFPVFVSNVVQVLGLGALADEAGLSYVAGEVAALPMPAGQSSVSFDGPTPLVGRVTGGQAVLPTFTRVGLYETDDEIEPPYDRLAVNLLDRLESNLQPVDQLDVGSVAVAGQDRTKAIRREVWPWFAWAALAVLLVEWLVYTRRMHL